ncbi:transcriptional regulator FNR [Campylobacterota bacterium]|nr:transcriptional regulator FNR [Campylobacterota bacterium]
MDENELSASCGFIQQLAKPIQQILLQHTRIKRAQKGEILYYENDEIEKIYFLISGSIKSYKVTRFDKEVFLFIQKASGLITTFAIEEEENRYFSNVECMIDSVVGVMDLVVMRDLSVKHEPLEIFIAKQLASQTRLLTAVIRRDLVFDSTAKVAYMIERELNEFNVFKKWEIAYMLNIQPETLSRILTKFTRDGMIDTDSNGSVVVLDHKSLIKIYEQ